MRVFSLLFLCFSLQAETAFGQVLQVDPKISTRQDLEAKVTVVQVAARFVTTIRLPEAVSSVVVGDPTAFQVEHSEHEPKLVFVKASSTKPGETNVLISTASGREVSLLLVNRGERAASDRTTVDFLLRYDPAGGFLVLPSAFPSALVGETRALGQAREIRSAAQALPKSLSANLASSAAEAPLPSRIEVARSEVRDIELDKLLEQQQAAPLPVLYGENVGEEPMGGYRIRAGVSRVMDGGQQVMVLFSVVNPTRHAILLMPPQVQLGGTALSGRVVHHKKWATAEQLPVTDFRLNRRRLGPGERADGVVLFERPPYKQSNETLLLQVAESGAVDRPALAPIGFGVSGSEEEKNVRGK
jgi:Flp pilus assembly secretin CpaC